MGCMGGLGFVSVIYRPVKVEKCRQNALLSISGVTPVARM